MPFDTPMAEPAPTRRSSRDRVEPQAAPIGDPGLSRSEQRRRAPGSTQTQPTVVWGRSAQTSVPAVEQGTVAGQTADAAASTAEAARVTETAPRVEPAPVTDSVEAAEPVEFVLPIEIPAPVASVDPTTAQPAAATRRARTTAVPTPAAEPLLRRRVRTSEPAAPEVPIAAVLAEPVAEPAEVPTSDEPAVAFAEPVTELRPVVEPVSTTTASFELIAPTSIPDPSFDAPEADDVHDSADVDAFAEAARLFSFTGETPIVAPAAAEDAGEPAPPVVVAHQVSRRSGGSAFRRVAAASFSVGVMGVVGLLTLGMTMPAEAVAAAGSDSADETISIVAPAAETAITATVSSLEPEEIQAYVAPAQVANAALDRPENYSTTTMQQIAADTGIRYSPSIFTNDPNAAIQWPFAVGVAMSYGYGMRWGRLHEGIDFIPGDGAPIQAIADGTVRIATEAGGNYGVTVYVDHVIDGKVVTSHYSHMQYGSLKVAAGDQVKVGQVVGLTGNTGRSFGAHLHFEIIINGSTIDPMPWLREHAGG